MGSFCLLYKLPWLLYLMFWFWGKHVKKVNQFNVDKSWKALLSLSGINVVELLRLADLPQDIFSRKQAGLNTLEYFRMWKAMEKLADESYTLTLLNAMSAEFFSPPIFASLCSPNLSVALSRLQQFKPLIGPMKLDIDETEEKLKLGIRFSDAHLEVPNLLIAMELGFFVQLARMATREHVVPVEVIAPKKLPHLESYTEFFGVEPKEGTGVELVFSKEDASRPFVTENEQMWEFFEPSLRRRLADLGVNDGMSERVRGALLELLPSGRVSIGDMASKLAVSKRTLQRRLGEEGTSFMEILGSLREELARHYITTSDLPYSQISFLLGYDDPNSFFRAFNAWTGSTPDTVRTQSLH